jgi:phosphatidylethanolamine/phosphatidyl-N-methylethanolamine N-methyltransferase
MGIAENWRSFCDWVNDPQRIGSVAATGGALARRVADLVLSSDAPLIELGAGTGAFAQEFLHRGVPQHRLALVELGSEFTEFLRLTYPEATVLGAAALGDTALFRGEKAGAVVCSLPMHALPGRQVSAILSGAFAHLRPGGTFYQVSFGPRFPIRSDLLERLGLEVERLEPVRENTPPASIHRITRWSPHGLAKAPDLLQQ